MVDKLDDVRMIEQLAATSLMKRSLRLGFMTFFSAYSPRRRPVRSLTRTTTLWPPSPKSSPMPSQSPYFFAMTARPRGRRFNTPAAMRRRCRRTIGRRRVLRRTCRDDARDPDLGITLRTPCSLAGPMPWRWMMSGTSPPCSTGRATSRQARPTECTMPASCPTTSPRLAPPGLGGVHEFGRNGLG
jgi:hypothetical protein